MEKLEFKGTQGNWKVINTNGLLFVAAPPFEGHPYYKKTTTIEVMSDEDYPTKVEDAHLIAASKDLLEACIADVRNMYDGEEHVGYQVDGMNGRVLCTFELTEFDHACQYVENLRKAAISKALNTTSNE